jgi:hypothetical protein
MIIVRLLSNPSLFGWFRTTEVYSGIGAGVVMEFYGINCVCDPGAVAVSRSELKWAVNRPMPAHSPVCSYETLQMRIVMFFANSDQTHPDQNSGISWARSETSYHGSRRRVLQQS